MTKFLWYRIVIQFGQCFLKPFCSPHSNMMAYFEGALVHT